MALTGTNGDNQTNIGSSKSIDFSIYDESSKEISVSNQKNPIEFWIPKDTSVSIQPYQFVNALNITQNQTDSNGFILNGFTLTGSNVSIHIQIKPNNSNTGYITLLKFGSNPIFVDTQTNINNQYYDVLNIYCPNDLIKNQPDLNDSFYLIFANMTKVNGFKGYVGYSIREISLTQLEINCFNKSLNNINSIFKKLSETKNQSSFSYNYFIRIYTSGCYYMNPFTSDWASNGMEILSDTNITHTHCVSNHLTTFAGGFIVLPSAIDFNNVWANASFLQNPVLYSTVIFLICLYILLAIWARYMDWKDSKKVGITLFGDANQNRENKYIYEIIVFTGNRPNAGTKSKV